jgi:hypothetical protein
LNHMTRGEHPNHERVCCPLSRGTNKETLKWQRSTWEGDQEPV